MRKLVSHIFALFLMCGSLAARENDVSPDYRFEDVRPTSSDEVEEIPAQTPAPQNDTQAPPPQNDVPAERSRLDPFQYQGETTPYVIIPEEKKDDKESEKAAQPVPFIPVPGGAEPPSPETEQAEPEPETGEESDQVGGQLYRLRIGDAMQVSIYGEPRTLRRIVVGPDGTLSYLFVHGIEAWGRSIDQVRRKLEMELSSYYRNPIVLMTPLEFVGDFYTILGEVRGPGLKAIKGEMTLLSAIAEAGGFRTRIFRDQTVDMIDLDHSFVSRNGECVDVDFNALVNDGDLSEDVKLHTGDYIYIAGRARQEIHVLGEVALVDTYEFFGHITLAEVLAEAGGVTGRASSRVAVIRGRLTNPVRYLIDINRILKGQAPDFPLKPSDIVYVPPRQMTSLREIVQAGVRNFVGTVASQAGTRAYVDINPDARGILAPQTSLNFGAPTTPTAAP